MKRTIIILAAVVGILAPDVAYAKTTSTPGYSYISNTDCAWTQAWLTDEGSRPGLWSVGTTDWFGNGSACGNNAYRAPTGLLALQQNLFKWDGAWTICHTNAPTVYNQVESHDVWTGFGWANPPCGNGFYRSHSQSWSWNGGWHSHTAILGNDWVLIQ